MSNTAPAQHPKPGDQSADEGWEYDEEVDDYHKRRDPETKEPQSKQRLMSAVQGGGNEHGRPQGGQGSGYGLYQGNPRGPLDDHGLEHGRGRLSSTQASSQTSSSRQRRDNASL